MPTPNGFIIRNLNLAMLGGDDEPGGHNPLDVDDPGAGDIPPDLGGDDPAEPKPVDDGLDDLFTGGSGDPTDPTDPEDKDATTKNPSVQAVLDKVRETLPKGLHSLIIDDILAPELTKAQAGFDAQMAEVQPWREIAKKGVTADQAIEALRIGTFIGDHPDQALRDIAQLVQTRGLNPAQILGIEMAANAAAAAGTAAGDTAEATLKALLGADADGVDLNTALADNPVLKAVLGKLGALEQNQQAVLTQAEQREEERRQEQEHTEIASAVEQVKAGFAARGRKFNEPVVLQYAVAYVDTLTDVQRENLSALDAIKQGTKMWLEDLAASAEPTRRAPRLGGGRGGLGVAGAPKTPEPPKGVEARKEKFLADMAAGRITGSE